MCTANFKPTKSENLLNQKPCLNIINNVNSNSKNNFH